MEHPDALTQPSQAFHFFPNQRKHGVLYFDDLALKVPRTMHSYARRSPLEKQLYFASKFHWRVTGRVHPSLITDQFVGGQRVYLVHNPKCGGSTLKALFAVSAKKTTHTFPRLMFRHALWRENLFVVSVRNPFDRFVSSYMYHVKSRYGGALVKRYGPSIKDLSPMEYLNFISQFPEKLSAQTNWTDYPSHEKPSCDVILRLEDSCTWVQTLARHSILLSEQEVPKRNATPTQSTPQGPQTPLAALLPADEITALRRRIEDMFRQDYLRFGYALLG